MGRHQQAPCRGGGRECVGGRHRGKVVCVGVGVCTCVSGVTMGAHLASCMRCTAPVLPPSGQGSLHAGNHRRGGAQAPSPPQINKATTQRLLGCIREARTHTQGAGLHGRVRVGGGAAWEGALGRGSHTHTHTGGEAWCGEGPARTHARMHACAHQHSAPYQHSARYQHTDKGPRGGGCLTFSIQVPSRHEPLVQLLAARCLLVAACRPATLSALLPAAVLGTLWHMRRRRRWRR
jgi:hypothetical protein